MVEDTLKKHAPGESFARQVEKILDGIENIEWKKGCDCFCGSVVACMQYLQEDVTYDLIAGISGIAFTMQWHLGWALDNCAPLVLGYEPIHRTFQTLGYAYTLIPHDFEKTTPENREEVWRSKIIDSINRGVPVIAFGVVGPPECCVIAGYAEDGGVLLGRSYFYEDSKGYFRQADWYKDCSGMILLGDKTEALPRAQTIRKSLEHAIELAQIAERNGRATGIAAYAAWAASLERAADFPPDDLETLTFRCMASTVDGFGYHADVRQTASRFLASLVDEVGDAGEDLQAAAKLYEEEGQLLWQGFKRAPTHKSSEQERLQIADRQLRLELAALIREAGEKDRQAIEYLESALCKMKQAWSR